VHAPHAHGSDASTCWPFSSIPRVDQAAMLFPGPATMSGASLPPDHPHCLLAGVPPPYSAAAVWPAQIRLLALVFRGMPFCCDLRHKRGQGVAWADFKARAVRAAASHICSAINISLPLPGMSAAWQVILAHHADPHSHLSAPRRHSSRSMCAFLVGCSCSTSSGNSFLQQTSPLTVFHSICLRAFRTASPQTCPFRHRSSPSTMRPFFAAPSTLLFCC
jgi:hypothetical protein